MRLFLDTNVYIIGAELPGSFESRILLWAGFGNQEEPSAKVILSAHLIKQILRVARRVRGKDFGGQIVNQIWLGMNIEFMALNLVEEGLSAEEEILIPYEDWEIFLAAKIGQATCFVSANHELIRAMATQLGLFECLTPEQFVRKYLP